MYKIGVLLGLIFSPVYLKITDNKVKVKDLKLDTYVSPYPDVPNILEQLRKRNKDVIK